ncbi:esterase E4-like [Ischnura elegans]|uniref:esterase E4-like n=1 Tax=Ischnura elegans TaxID=197161 RepID=UPI001ED8B8DF|nr:esterase E4-like [Ischnura elegans]
MSTSTIHSYWKYYFITLFFIGWSEGAEFTVPIISTDDGKVQGSSLLSAKGRRILAYRGIPYAKPPLEDLRFKPPEPVYKWGDVKNATEEGNVCPQKSMLSDEVIGNEDCLTLNVYTPKIPEDKSGRLPVMVWIHGGLFIQGSGGADLYGPEYLLDEDIVLVTINYRLGALGFLSTGNEEVPGNNGLKDQVMALKWVKTNIGNFGGDPTRTTIFGNSAGGASVHYHILSPLSKGLFNRAISQSGSALNPWAFTSQGPQHALQLAAGLGCEDEGVKQMVNCMRGHPAERIVKVTSRLKEWGTDFFNPFVPVAEGKGKDAFLPSDPRKMMKDGKMNKVKYILGVTSDEGILFSLQLLRDHILLNDMKYEMYRHLPIYLGYQGDEEKDAEITAKIHDFYFKNESLQVSEHPNFYKMDMDHKILYGVAETAKILSQITFPKVYFYVLSYDGGIGLFSPAIKDIPKGVSHGDELVYMFTSKLFPKELKAGTPQAKISERLIKMWTNFASEGNPTPEVTETLPTIWEPYKGKTKDHLDIGIELRMKTSLYDERVAFWDSIFAMIRKQERIRDEL